MARLRLSATDGSPLPMVATDGPHHIVRYANLAFCRLCRISSTELVGRPYAETVSAGRPDRCLELLNAVYRTGGGASLSSDERLLPDGSATWWSYRAWAICGEGGPPTGVMMQVTDTTEACRARSLASEMNQALVLSGLRQNQQVEEAEEGSRQLRLAMRETDHRVKNHLHTIGALLDMQKETHGEVVPAEALNQVIMQVRSLAYIHAMLTKHPEDDPQNPTVSVRALLSELMKMWEGLVGVGRATWSVEDTRLPAKRATSLAVAVNELVGNAVKHGASMVEVRLQARTAVAELEVADDGPGFPAGFAPGTHAIFGLDLVETVVRTDLRGAVTYENRREGGARVVVTFPIPDGHREM